MLRNNQYSYNFLPISANATDYNIDFPQLTETPLAETITSPGNNLQVDVFAKPDANYSDTYNFGMTRSQSNLLVYYYPVEKFPEYDVLEFYSINNLNYLVSTAGPSIPAQAASFNASFSLQGSTLADFVPSCSGDFDFYHANFLATAPYLEVDLYSPSAANYYNIKLPDFSPYLNVASIDLTGLKLKEFDLDQMNGFNEKNFYYSNFVSSTTMNYKYVEQVLP